MPSRRTLTVSVSTRKMTASKPVVCRTYSTGFTSALCRSDLRVDHRPRGAVEEVSH